MSVLSVMRVPAIMSISSAGAMPNAPISDAICVHSLQDSSRSWGGAETEGGSVCVRGSGCVRVCVCVRVRVRVCVQQHACTYRHKHTLI